MASSAATVAKDAGGAGTRLTKLQSIQLAIETGNLRKAMLLLEGKDMAHVPAAKALRAWALDRNGNRDAAMDLALEVMVSAA